MTILTLATAGYLRWTMVHLLDGAFSKSLHGSCCHQRPDCCPWSMLLSRLCWYLWSGQAQQATLIPVLLSKAMLVSVVQDATWCHVNVHGSCCCQWPSQSLWPVLQEAMLMSVVCAATRGQVAVHGPCCHQGPW